MEVPEDARKSIPIEVQDSQIAALNQLLMLITSTEHSGEDITTIRQLLDSSSIGSYFPMTTNWCMVSISLPLLRVDDLRIKRMAEALEITAGPDRPDVFETLATWFAAAVEKMQPGMEPVDWSSRLDALAEQLEGDDRLRLDAYKTAVHHLPGPVKDWHQTLCRAR